MGELVGKEPNIIYQEDGRVISAFQDNTKRLALGCLCEVTWQEGMRRMVAARHPEVTLQPV